MAASLNSEQTRHLTHTISALGSASFSAALLEFLHSWHGHGTTEEYDEDEDCLEEVEYTA